MTPRALFPTFATDVLSASRDFYVGLGFEAIHDGCGYVHLAWPDEPGLQIGFIQRGLEGQAPVYQTRFRGGGVFLGIEVDDVDVVFNRLRAHGHRIVVPLTREPWGRRHFGILDPNGVPIDIYSNVPTVAEMAGCVGQAATA